jgi:hypothetical protein
VGILENFSAAIRAASLDYLFSQRNRAPPEGADGKNRVASAVRM